MTQPQWMRKPLSSPLRTPLKHAVTQTLTKILRAALAKAGVPEIKRPTMICG